MSMLLRRTRPAQLPLFACLHPKPQTSPSWAALSTDVQQKMVQLLAQLLRHHCTRCRAAGAAKEVANE
jgi:hypothetical protein